MKTVDILLPTYNGEKFLTDQIKSILDQSYGDFKLLIRDDCSNDTSLKKIQQLGEMDSRIRVFEDHSVNLGLVSNVEYLLNQSTSDYIMYCDQDDFWLPNKIEKLFNAIKDREDIYGNSTPLIVHSDNYVTDEDLNILKRHKGTAPLSYGLENCLFNYFVQGASSIFNRALKDNLLPFPSGIYIHDRYTHLVGEILGHRHYLNEPLMLYRQHSSNLVGSKGIVDKIKNNIALKDKFYIEKDYDLIFKLSKRYPDQKLLKIYLNITSSKQLNKYQKLSLLRRNKISLRIKEWFWFILVG